MKKAKKIKVGVIGLGRVSHKHIQDSIKKIEGLKLEAVCDIDKKKAKSIAKKERVKCYFDYRDLIKDKDIDLVSISTPNYLHYQMGILTANNGKHCVMEKPIALNFPEGQKLVRAFRKAGKYIFPVLQVRYNPAVQITKDCIVNKCLGKILTGVLSIHWTRPQQYYDESPWKGSKALDGGGLLSQAIHYLDIMQYILGPAKSVFGKTDTAAHKIEVEDIANAIIDLKNGARINFDFTLCAYPHNIGCSLTILGEKGTVKIGGLAMNELTIWKVKGIPRPLVPKGLSPNVYAKGAYVGSCPNHKLVYLNIIDVLINGKESFVNGKDALESLRIVDGIRLSSYKKKEILL